MSDLLKALIQEPSTYTIDVVDGSMLSDNRKIVTLKIPPPTLETLAKVSLILSKIPESIRTAKELQLNEVVKYNREMAEMLTLMAKEDSWCIDFLIKNITAKELFQLFYEGALKVQTDFFLNFFQIANQNPMAMRSLTLTN